MELLDRVRAVFVDWQPAVICGTQHWCEKIRPTALQTLPSVIGLVIRVRRTESWRPTLCGCERFIVHPADEAKLRKLTGYYGPDIGVSECQVSVD